MGIMAFRQNCINISSLANNQLLPNIAGLAPQPLKGFHVRAGNASSVRVCICVQTRREGTKGQQGSYVASAQNRIWGEAYICLKSEIVFN